jgi:hypothetical protein
VTSICGSLAAGKTAPRGAAVSLSGTPLLAEASLPLPATFAALLADASNFCSVKRTIA